MLAPLYCRSTRFCRQEVQYECPHGSRRGSFRGPRWIAHSVRLDMVSLVCRPSKKSDELVRPIVRISSETSEESVGRIVRSPSKRSDELVRRIVCSPSKNSDELFSPIVIAMSLSSFGCLSSPPS